MTGPVLHLRSFSSRDEKHVVEIENPRPSNLRPPLRIDVNRMSAALASQRFDLPQGLTSEEIRHYIIAAANSSR